MSKEYKALVCWPLNGGVEEITIDRSKELDQLQALVGGFIETVNISSGVIAVVNDEGKLLNLPPTMDLGYDILYGPVVLVGQDGPEFTDVPQVLIDGSIGNEVQNEED